MNDQLDDLGTGPRTPARKSPRKRERRNLAAEMHALESKYAAEVHALQGRIATAVRLLKRMPALGGEQNPLLAVAVEILEE